MKYLILNADDFGYNPQQTKAITELYEKGLITSTSLMTVAEDACNAAEIAREKSFAVGVHLTVNSDSASNPWQSISGAKSLGTDGLYESQKDLAIHATRADIRKELEAQYAFLIASGCTVDHADNHCGTLYGINGRRFFIDAFDFCARHGLPYRFPKTPYFLERQLGRKIPHAVVLLQKAIVGCGEKRGVKMPDDIVPDPRPIEQIGSYENLREYYLDAVRSCIEGVTEMFFHPAYPQDDTFGGWTKRVYEFELLKSGDILECAADNGIKVVSWSIFENIV